WDGPALLTARSHFNPDAETDDLLIDISIVHSTDSAVANFLEPIKKIFREHITIKPKQRGDKVIQDGAQAVHMAHFVRTQIMEKGVSGATTHIVGSFPLGLAVFIGMHLNACGSIQCYEHKEKHEDEGVHKTYVPTCLLVRQ
ncbi:MAG: SAVED domain-containing protein, partial [Chloroflexota bacterium]